MRGVLQLAAAALCLVSITAVDMQKYHHCNELLERGDASSADTIECAEIVHEYEMEKVRAEVEAEETARKLEAQEREVALADARKKAKEEARRKKLEEEKANSAEEVAKRNEAEKQRVRAAEQRRRELEEQQRIVSNHDSTAKEVKVVAKDLAACDRKLDYAERKLAAGCLPIDPSIAPLFDLVPLSFSSTASLLLAAVCGVFWVLGCLAAASQVVEITTITAESRVKIMAIVVTPTRESIIIVNQSSSDLDMTGASITVDGSLFQFDDGFNLARGTRIEVVAGREAKKVKEHDMAEHDKFDSRRITKLYWTQSSIFKETPHTAILLDPTDAEVSKFVRQ